jgi:hypothetical protein
MTEKNINTIKTRDDFEWVAIHYNPETITEEQKQKILEWQKNIYTDQYHIIFDSNDKYIRFDRDIKEDDIASREDYYYNIKDQKRYTIIELEDFLCEKTPEQNVCCPSCETYAPAIIDDAHETWQKFTDAWNALYHKAEKIKSKNTLETLTAKIKEI